MHTYIQVIDTARGQALATEFNMKFFETSAKSNINVEKAFFEIARDVVKRLHELKEKTAIEAAKTGTAGKKEGTVKLEKPAAKSGSCRC